MKQRPPKPCTWVCGGCGARAVFPDGKLPATLPHLPDCEHWSTLPQDVSDALADLERLKAEVARRKNPED